MTDNPKTNSSPLAWCIVKCNPLHSVFSALDLLNIRPVLNGSSNVWR